ncbi:MAG: glycine--tRNA ligase subunit beta [Gemmobacter sp.]
MPDLLIELFSEEIPARMQGKARDDLKRMVTDGLVEAGLTYAGAGAFSTPRRLTLTVQGLSAESRAVREERKGPSTSAPQQAIDGFLRSTGLRLDQLERRADKKGETFFAVIEKPGRKAPAIIAEVLEATIRNFPWPKSMRWGSGSLRWVRPLHSILCILSDEAGAEVVPLEVDGIRSGNTTEGHRFMAPGRFAVSSFDDYAAKLRAAKVMLDPAEREAHIWNHATQTAFARGLEVVEDKALLTEVAGLVEWPVPLMGPIADEFLHLPPEVLQTSMREHQKFFSVKNPKTGRIEKFLTVANTETADHGATILKGNGKVLAARLSDARFFWDNDLRVAKAGMADWAEGLKAVTFHNKLGSQADRIARIAALARGEADVMQDVAPRDVARIAALDGVKVAGVPTQAFQFIGMNTQTAPFDNPKVRAAIAAALPYDAMFAAALHGRGQPLWGDDPAAGLRFPQPMGYVTDLDRARALMAESGVGPVTVPFAFDLGQAAVAEPVAILLQEALAQIGITVEIEKVPAGQLGTRLQEKTVPFFFEGSIAFLADPDYFFRIFYNGETRWNFGSYRNAEFATLVERTRHETDRAAYEADVARMIALAKQDLPLILLWHPTLDVAMRADVTGYGFAFHRMLDLRPLARG